MPAPGGRLLRPRAATRASVLIWGIGLGLGLAGHAAFAGTGARTGLALLSGACDRPTPLSAAEQDRVLRVADRLRRLLAEADARLALVARSGLDLRRFGQRYSHAALALPQGLPNPWAVRQLYYACDERRPRLFDQGLAGFLAGLDDLSVAYVSVQMLPAGAAAEALAGAALDARRGHAVLSQRYSANAYAWSTQRQNCNQWLAELMALAWADPPLRLASAAAEAVADRAGPAAEDPDAPVAGPADADTDTDTDASANARAGFEAAVAANRAQAQRWLDAAGYQPQPVAVPSPLWLAAAGLMPLLSVHDHPPPDREALRLKVSLPPALEALARSQVPGARRLELCHTAQHIVWRWEGAPLQEGCTPQPGDGFEALD